MFPELAAFVVDDAKLESLAAAMVDTNDAVSDDNPAIPAGFTYLGQFIDHDITFDPTTVPEMLVDPQSVFNFRTPKVELDNVYGTGPATQPYLYEGDGASLRVGATQTGDGDPTIPAGLPNDLIRLGATAVIGDPRNDENLAVAQTHLAFIKFHNAVVAQLKADGVPAGELFQEARRLVSWHYQRIILDDYLPRLCVPAVLDNVVANGPQFFDFEDEPFMPVEFSVAAYRLGHSQIRNTYDFNRVFREGGLVPASLDLLFKFTGLSGDTTPVPSDWIIDWRRFFDFGAAGGGVAVNATRKLDPFLATRLHDLPNNEGSLPERNLKRGVRLGLPSGQAVADAIGATPLTPAEIAGGSDGPAAAAAGFDVEGPLWHYILKEAAVRQGGLRLGEVGSRIVAEVFVGMMDGDAMSFRRQAPGFAPTLFRPGQTPSAPGKYTMVDMLTFVDDLNPIG
jgi:hypothetical protein